MRDRSARRLAHVPVPLPERVPVANNYDRLAPLVPCRQAPSGCNAHGSPEMRPATVLLPERFRRSKALAPTVPGGPGLSRCHHPPHIRYVTSFPSVLLLTPLAEYRHQHCEVPQQICEILHRLAVILLSIRFDDIFEPNGMGPIFSNDNYAGVCSSPLPAGLSAIMRSSSDFYPSEQPTTWACRGHWRPR